MPSPLQRSIAILKGQGYHVARGEHWNSFARIRQDLYGFGDLLVTNGDHIALVQVTTTGNMGAREKKIFSLPVHRIWLSSGGRIFVHGWAKRGARGKRKTWTLQERELLDTDTEPSGHE
jgi:hypothetical protein